MHIHPPNCLEGPVSFGRTWRRDPGVPAVPDKLDKPLAEDDPPFRADLVARIRREIAEGKYGTDEQLEQALENYLKRLDKDEA